jgi:hypothetical protein
MKTKRSSLPSKESIHNYWKSGDGHRVLISYGIEIPDQTKFNGDKVIACFACGRSEVQRCHIVAVSSGGSDYASNLHLLCPRCHVESELLEGEHYWRWLKYQFDNNWDEFTEHLHLDKVKKGYDEKVFSELLSKGNKDEAMKYHISFLTESDEERKVIFEELKQKIEKFK